MQRTNYKTVRAKVTDNGSNFVKAFREFSTPENQEEEAEEQDDGIR